MNSNPDIDLSQAGAGADAIGTAIADFIANNCVPCILGVVGAALCVYMIWSTVAWLKRMHVIK